ncbi:uncharacterized protein [Euphorbia lathyris]|uniref:uncharacterized protein isoform X2 n=1 Tax=Euphorbia lathyris TaxID=212925 RepID=UPI003313BC45
MASPLQRYNPFHLPSFLIFTLTSDLSAPRRTPDNPSETETTTTTTTTVLKNVEWLEQFPFKDEDFQPFDETPDSVFYEAPRFVTHIDDPAIAALTKYYSDIFPPNNIPGVSILDICSSWVGHFQYE